MKKRITGIIVTLLVLVAVVAGCSTTMGSVSNDKIKINKYKGLEIPKSAMSAEVTDQEVEAEVNSRLETSSTYVEKKGKIAEGDMVKLDTQVMVGDKAVETLAATDAQIRIGEDYFSFGQAFDNALIGHEKGDKLKEKVKLPDTAGSEYAGKDAVVHVTIKGVGEMKAATLDEEWLKANGDGAKTKEEYYAKVKEERQAIREESLKSGRRYEVVNALVKECEFVKEPTDCIQQMYQSYMDSYEAQAQASGLSLDDYIKNVVGKERSEVEADLKETCANTIKEEYALDLIAETEQITVSEEEMKKEVERLMKDYGFTDENSFFNAFSEDSVKKYLVQTKTIDFLLDNAVEVDPAELKDNSSEVQSTETKTDAPSQGTEDATQEVTPSSDAGNGVSSAAETAGGAAGEAVEDAGAAAISDSDKKEEQKAPAKEEQKTSADEKQTMVEEKK